MRILAFMALLSVASASAHATAISAVRWDIIGEGGISGYFVYPASFERPCGGDCAHDGVLDGLLMIGGTTISPISGSFLFREMYDNQLSIVSLEGSNADGWFSLVGERGDYFGFRALINGVSYCSDSYNACQPGDLPGVDGLDGPHYIDFQVAEPTTAALLALGLIGVGLTRRRSTVRTN